MKFPDDAPVQARKLDELRRRVAALAIDLPAVDEQAIRSRGPGGQKVNKTSSGVLLRCLLRGDQIVVKWTRERHRSLNRFLALRELVDRIEMRISPGTSARLREISRKRRQKDRVRRRRAAAQGD
jgi:protein subunit release factor B